MTRIAKPHDELLRLVQSYFDEHLRNVRGASPNTVLAYRDSLRLFLCFLADSTDRPIEHLGLDDITVDPVLAFLEHLETTRGNSTATRNYRLAAINGFIGHLLRHDPTRAGQYQRILSIPSKKVKIPTVTYLEPEEVQVLLRQPNPKTFSGQRDYTLLLFLYNTGARVSEALAARVQDLQLIRPHQIRLHGKGNKERFCPLWRSTTDALQQMLAENGGPGRHLFLNLRRQPLSRDGVAYLLEKYVERATRELPTIANRRVTPHVLRHSCAVALLQAGVDIAVIRDYLGHVSIATTSRYISTNLQLKREVLEAFWQRAQLTTLPAATWHPKPELLAFLASL